MEETEGTHTHVRSCVRRYTKWTGTPSTDLGDEGFLIERKVPVTSECLHIRITTAGHPRARSQEVKDGSQKMTRY